MSYFEFSTWEFVKEALRFIGFLLILAGLATLLYDLMPDTPTSRPEGKPVKVRTLEPPEILCLPDPIIAILLGLDPELLADLPDLGGVLYE